MGKERFKLIYDTETAGHLKCIPKKYHSVIQKAIEESLIYEPDKEHRNRKPLLPPTLFDPGWELRCGLRDEFRIFYRVNRVEREVYILAIGVKTGNKLIIGKEKISL